MPDTALTLPSAALMGAPVWSWGCDVCSGCSGSGRWAQQTLCSWPQVCSQELFLCAGACGPLLIAYLLLQGPDWNCLFPPLSLNSSSKVFYFNYYSGICKSFFSSFKRASLYMFDAKTSCFVKSGTLPKGDWAYRVAGR